MGDEADGLVVGLDRGRDRVEDSRRHRTEILGTRWPSFTDRAPRGVAVGIVTLQLGVRAALPLALADLDEPGVGLHTQPRARRR